MNKWKTLAIPGIDGVSEAISAVETAVDFMAGLMDVLAEILDSLATMMSAFIDTVQLALQALIAVLTALRDQLKALMNGMIWFYLDPGPLHSGAEPDGLNGFFDRWERSFEDKGDKERPVLPQSTQISVMFIVIGADTFSAFKEFLAKLGQLFSLPDLEWPDLEEDEPLPKAIENSMSTPPDWRRHRLSKVLPPFAKLVELLDKCIKILVPAEAYADVIAQVAFIVQEKSIAMADLADQLRGLVDVLEAIIASTGLHTLIVSELGTTAVIEAAKEATARPPFGHDAFVGGLCLLAATPDFGPVIELLGEGIDG